LEVEAAELRRLLVVSLIVVLPMAAAAQFRTRPQMTDATVAYDSHFAFTRIRYGGSGFGFGGAAWSHDYPTADRNLGSILDYITNMRVRLDGTNVLDLDDPRIFENPILYVSEPGYWRIAESEAKNLRAHLLKGGFIIFDDFEGPHFDNMAAQMRQAVPELQWIQIDVNHPIFQTFFPLKVLDVPHPSERVAPRYMALFENNDPGGRMVALANHNSDLAEYWEWSAEGLYSEDPTNNAYRLGVNYIVYGMTH
jgi:hypothetical protein